MRTIDRNMKMLIRLVAAILAYGMLALLSSSLPALADDTVSINNQAVVPGESAAQCYHDATEHLRHGEWFERAIAQLKEAIRQDPKNPDYHLALGCAYADRAASIGYAEGYALKYKAEVAQYPKDLADWQKAQKDPDSDNYGDPKPTPPPAFTAYTKDDQKVIDMPAKEVEDRMAELGDDAVNEWTKAVSLTKTPADRAHAEYVQGWGMYMLSWYADYDWFYEDLDDETGVYKKDAVAHMEVPSLPSNDDAIAAFKNATKDDPKNAVYWQSLGDADWMNEVPSQDKDSAADKDSSVKDYRQALTLNPKNPLLWFFLANDEKDNPKQAEEDMKQAAKSDPANAFYSYLVAGCELKQSLYNDNWRNGNDAYEDKVGNINDTITDPDARKKAIQGARDQAVQDLAKTGTPGDRKLIDEAIRLVEKGNAAPFCSLPEYHPKVPDWLSVAFAYRYEGFSPYFGFSNIRNIARVFASYADVAALQNDLPGAIHANQLSIAMALKLIGDWRLRDQTKYDPNIIMEYAGMGIANTGYSALTSILGKYADSDTAQAAQDEYKAVKDQITEWNKERDEVLAGDSEDYADY